MQSDTMELDFITRKQQELIGGSLGATLSGVRVSSAGSAAGSRSFAAAVPPWLQEPEGHLPFDEADVANVGAVAAVAVNVLQFTVPQGYDGVVERISNNFTAGGFVSGSGDLLWRILADDRPLKNYSRILVEFGTLQIPRPVNKIRIYAGQIITYTVSHPANAALTGGGSVCTLSGYYYPRVEVLR